MSLLCPECKTDLRETAKFCDGCGIKIIPSTKEGGTIMMPDSGQLDDGSTTMLPLDTELEEGGTIMMPDSGTIDDDSGTIVMPEFVPSDTDTDQSILYKTTSMPEKGRKVTATAIGEIRIGQILQERYRVNHILGRGGFGAAYLAQDIKLRRSCVVKQMLIPKNTPTSEIDLYRANFEREAGLLVQLNHPGHPNIPEIYDYFTDVSGNYLVMKYIEGQSLDDILKSEAKIPWREGVRYAVGVSDALNYMHSMGGNDPVMHRDIKPANILLGNDGRVWLVDFGLAKATAVEGANSDFAATQAAGTVGFTPMEQWLGEAVPASDVYALGATLHYLVTGVNPISMFDGKVNIEKLQESHGKFTPIRKIDRGLPKELNNIISQAMAVEPKKRLTALQFKQQLEGLISGSRGAGLFTFKSGEIAKTTVELVDLCEKYRSEAKEYLYKGEFERWFLIINRNDLAEAASRAVQQGKNQKDGLEKFLKLIVPNIFLRRMGKAGWKLTKGAVQALFVFAITVLLVAFIGSYAAKWLIQQSISSYPWDYTALNIDKGKNRYSQRNLTEKFNSAVGVYFDSIEVEVNPPDQLDINAVMSGINIKLPVILRLEDKKPRFYLTNLNGYPLFFVADNISQGINNGVDNALGPIDVTSLELKEKIVIAEVKSSGRVPLPTPLPPTPTPVASPTPVNMTLVVIFNELEQDIILELGGTEWQIAAHDSKALEKRPDSYDYVIRYSKTGQIASEGIKTWDLKVYRWYINITTIAKQK